MQTQVFCDLANLSVFGSHCYCHLNYQAVDRTINFAKAIVINHINEAWATNWFIIVNSTEEAFIASPKETVAFPTILDVTMVY